jgi:S1-C subfamily serine protease
MIAQELHPFPYQPESPAPPSDSSPPRRRGRWQLAGLGLAAVLLGTGIGSVTASLIDRAPSTPAAATASNAPTTTSSSTTAASSSGTLSAESIYAQDSPSVVTISTEVVGRFGQQGEGTGSGIVLDARGDVVTNAHVIAGAQQITVTFSDGTTAAATVLGSNSSADLAVLRVDVGSSHLHPISVGNSDSVQVGDHVYAIGAPFGLSGTLTEGVVSGLHRSNSSSSRATGDLIQTDAAINPGNSGGALIDSQGRLIGITESITSPVNGNVGVGFAIPVNEVESMLPTLEA